MSTFPVKKFVHSSGHSVEGEVILTTTESWQVAVGGKIHVLARTEWSESSGLSDLFGSKDLFGGLFNGR